MILRNNQHCRVLVVDDNEAIHDDFKKILGGSSAAANSLDEAAAGLFGQTDVSHSAIQFEIESADQGRKGLAMVKRASEEGRPYTIAFVDIRMPPGWDGIETIERIWDEDSEIQIVICTAYSDYSANEILETLGVTDRLLILKKPFDCSEVVLMANMLNSKWHLSKATAAITEVMAERAFDTCYSLDS